MSSELKCPICGKPTYLYFGNPRKDKLCENHGTMINNGTLILCQKCNKYHAPFGVCTQRKRGEPITSCIICGNETKIGHHFCSDCYTKYSSKTIAIIVTKGKTTDVQIVDKYGNKTWKNKAGVYVRSQQELILSNQLFDEGIRVEYEKTVPHMENGELKELHPDFYLPDYDLYIEHWGINDSQDYENTKEYREKKYEELGYKLFGTTEQDIHDIQRTVAKIKALFKKIK